MTSLIIIDEEPEFLDLMGETFSDCYEVTTFKTGQKSLQYCEEILPDIVLLDIGLHDMDGYEVCKKIKEYDSEDSCSVIFVSGQDSLDDRIKGYSVGADDFISKPIRVNELVAKVKNVSRFQKQKKALSQQEKTARDMAYKAMTEASRFGNLIRFIQQILEADSLSSIADCVVRIVHQFSLNCCIQIRSKMTLSIRSDGQPCSPIEEDLFNILKDTGRVHSFKRRSMFNAKHLSILITDMPEDELFYGEVTDLLAIIVEVTEVAIVNTDRKIALETSLTGMNDTLSFIAASFEKEKTDGREIIHHYLVDVEKSLGRLGLTEEQEHFFITRAEKMEEELFTISLGHEEIKNNVKNVIHHIRASL